MAQTYSQGMTGINANARYNVPLNVRVGDADLDGTPVGPLANPGAQQSAMMTNDYILCKNPDGSQSYYTIDAERSIPGVSLVMRPV